MNNISSYLVTFNFLILGLGLLSFFAKVLLYSKVEKEWDFIRFLHFSRIDLKMTVSKELRSWRKRQNLLTNLFLTFILLFGMLSFFQMIISG